MLCHPFLCTFCDWSPPRGAIKHVRALSLKAKNILHQELEEWPGGCGCFLYTGQNPVRLCPLGALLARDAPDQGWERPVPFPGIAVRAALWHGPWERHWISPAAAQVCDRQCWGQWPRSHVPAQKGLPWTGSSGGRGQAHTPGVSWLLTGWDRQRSLPRWHQGEAGWRGGSPQR